MSDDWSPFTQVLIEDKAQRVPCKLCRFISEASSETARLITRALETKDEFGEYLYGHSALAKAFAAQGDLKISETTIRRHRAHS